MNARFPDSPEALTQQFIENIPRDPITRQPLKYRRTDDGRFLLYSAGWNGTNDGGVDDTAKGKWIGPTRTKD